MKQMALAMLDNGGRDNRGHRCATNEIASNTCVAIFEGR